MQVTWEFFLQIYSHLTTLSPLESGLVQVVILDVLH